MSYDPYPSGRGSGRYQPFSGGNQLPDQDRGPVPRTVIYAVWLMYAGAVVSAISFIINMTGIGSLRSTIKADNPTFSPSDVNLSVHISIVAIVIFGLLGIGMWIWMAFTNKAGKNWARITGTVFCGIATVIVVFGFVRAGSVAGPRILTVIIWLIGVAAVVLLWRRDSSAFFKPPHQQQW
jgi:hypothetical protein